MSTTHKINGILLLSALVSLSGCSGLGRFSRQDYATLTADPFLDSDSDFGMNDGVPTGDSSTSGFARLENAAEPSSTAVATIPDTRVSGPSLSDFLGQGADDSRTVAPPVPGTITSAADSLNASRAQLAANGDTARDTFLDWATSQNRAIRQTSGQRRELANNTVQTADHQLRQQADEVKSAISEFPSTVARQTQATATEFFDEETAEPLIQNGIRQAAAATRAVAENPFAEIERQQQSRNQNRVHPTATMKTAAAPASSGRIRTADGATTGGPQWIRESSSTNKFAQDSGWRPANLEFP